jgi:hypothetical protein
VVVAGVRTRRIKPRCCTDRYRVTSGGTFETQLAEVSPQLPTPTLGYLWNWGFGRFRCLGTPHGVGGGPERTSSTTSRPQVRRSFHWSSRSTRSLPDLGSVYGRLEHACR